MAKQKTEETFEPRRLTDAIMRALPLPASGTKRVMDAHDPDKPKA